MKKFLFLFCVLLAGQSHAQLTLSGGTLQVNSGGTLTVNDASQLSSGTFYLNGGTAAFNGTVTNTGVALWPTSGANFSAQSGTWHLYPGSHAASQIVLAGSASLYLSQSDALEVTTGIEVTSTTGGLILEGTSGSYAQLKTPSIIGGGRVVRQMPLTSVTGWRQIAFPVSTDISVFDDELIVNNNTAPTAQQNAFWWDATPTNPGGPLPADAFAKGWTAVTPTEPLGPTKPLNVFVGAPYFPAAWSYLEVEGSVPANTHTFSIYRTDYLQSSGNAGTVGWQLAGNPYLCNLDVVSLLNDAINFPLAYKAVHVWDPALQQYRVITSTASVPAINGNGNTVNLAPMQAFWVKGDGIPSSSGAPAESFTTTPAHQSLTSTPLYTFKDAPPSIRITATQLSSGLADELLIQHIETALPTVEPGWDAFKLRSLNPSAPYLAVQTTESDLSIYSSTFSATERYTLNLLVEQETEGSMMFSAHQHAFDEFDIWLETPSDHKFYDLKKESTTLHLTPKQTINLHIGKWGSELQNGTFVKLVCRDGSIYITLDGQPDVLEEVSVFNSIGQLLYHAQIQATEHFITLSNPEPLLFLKMRTKSGLIITEKVSTLP